MVFIAKIGTFHIEAIELGSLKQILHPEYPKGPLSYNPQFHYNYIVAFFARFFGYEANSPELAGIFWFLEQALTLIVLVKLCDFLFKDDRLTLVLVISIYLMLKSGETDQKTMLRPLHFLAIYYFLKEKWLLAAILSASIFYLHIGVAIWWFVPSCFALGIMYLFKNKQVTIIQIAKYAITVLLLASSVLYFYMEVTQQPFTNSDFFTRYLYGINNSVLLNLVYDPKALIMLMITFGVFTVGYMKWKTSGGRNDYIVPIVLGVLILYALDFVLVDVMFNGAAIKMQLLRSKLNVEFFASLFFAFLIARQLREGNIVFFVMLLILLIPNPFWIFYSVVGRWDVLYVFYAVVVIYEIFERPIGVARAKINLFFSNKLILPQFKKTTNWIQHFFQNPVNLAGFFIVLYVLFITMSLSPVKPYVKSVLGISEKTSMSKSESLFQNIAKFTNEKITGNNALILFPFYDVDFEFYTKHKVFMNSATPIYSSQNQNPFFAQQFQSFFENDLNYSIEKLRSGGSWDEIWRSVDEDLILKWRKAYGITHVIRENELSLNFPVAYENEYYKVYDLRLLSNS
jgi:hypothetical protein